MTRIFPTLASLSLMLMAVALGFGFTIGDLYADPPAPATLTWRSRHMLTGVAAALAVVLVECIAMTYFIGTSRWVKEVTETYGLPPAELAESGRLKRRTFPWCVLGMLTVVVVAALGAASDPGTGRSNTADIVDVHLAAALVGLCIIAWTYYRAWLNIAANQDVITRIVAQVQRIRSERGLDVPASLPEIGRPAGGAA
jgi:hypothetical protein